uniref:Uncharacterized protein n=1 Tax=Pseudo-nitzschia australis TaxID=44445 RepID=A0A6U9X154_9STRA
MSVSLEHDKNGQQPAVPPHKRQRVLPEGTGGSSGPTLSPSSGNETSCNPSGDSAMAPPRSVDNGPIFTDVEDVVDGYSSVESVLGVPTQILFRQVGGDGKNKDGKNNGTRRKRRRPLLTRQEMEQFLRLTLLAQEIDVLVDLSETVLSRRRFARRFRHDILMQRDPGVSESSSSALSSPDIPWKNPWLITLGPILDVLEQRQRQPDPSRRLMEQKYQQKRQQDPLYNTLSNPQHNTARQDVLHHVHEQIMRLCHELQACGVYELERSAEQNRSLVASLTDIVGYDIDNGCGQDEGENENETGRTSAVRILAKEKHALSKLQDHLSRRVRSFLASLCFSPVSTTTDSSGSSGDCEKVGDNDNDDDNDNNRKKMLFEDQLSSSSTVVRTGGSNRNGSDKDNDNDKKLAAKSSHCDDNVDDDDDGSSLMSLEETMIPLEVICRKLFEGVALKPTLTSATSTPMVRDSNDKVEKDAISHNSSDPIQKERQRKQQQQKTTLSRTGNDSTSSLRPNGDPGTTIMGINTTEASQNTVGAAAVMMTFATKTNIEPNPPCHEQSKAIRSDMHGSIENHNREVAIGNSSKKNKSCKLRHSGNDDDDDGSFVEDPPSDKEEDKNDDDGNKNQYGTNKKNATTKNMGIFDVVDVLTPSSQSDQPEEELQRGCKEATDDFHDDSGYSDRAEEQISSLSSQSQTAAETLTHLINGNTFRYN